MKDSDAPRFRAAYEAFQELCDLPAEEREARLADLEAADPELHGEVRALLAADGRGHALDGDPLELVSGLGFARASGSGEKARPERVGPFEILDVLGRGGMGVVYEARQETPARRVALKLLPPGLVSPERLRRFEHEARVLAWLNHPGIAQVYAAGTERTSAGLQPYIAMELVRGVRIDRHVREAGLGFGARLELVAELCDAIQYAHRKGVIHRDLKPANVLVTEEGRVKVLDFGVARITDADLETLSRRTEIGEVLGTLPYMSPEQLRGDPAEVDTRSDVYALGVLAYELLAGQRPLDVARRGLAEAARIVEEQEPTTLGHVDPRLRGDVETIVAKALAKEKERRYASAEELASDIRRHLADEPILARPASRADQLRRFARRHKGLVAGLALAFLILAGGAVVSTTLYLRSRRNLARAEEAEGNWREAAAEAEVEATVAREVTDFLVGVFEVSDPSGAAGARVTGLELLDRGRERIEEELVEQPRVRAELLNAMARVYFNLGQWGTAQPLLEESLAAQRANPDADPLALASTLFALGEILHYDGHFDQVEPYYAEALALREEHLPPGDLLLARTIDVMGRLQRDLGGPERRARARELALRAQALRIEADAPPLELSESLQSLAFLAHGEGRLDEAERLIREALAIREALPEARFHVPELRHTLARLVERHDPGEAEELLLRNLEESREIFGEDHVFVGYSLNGLAGLARADGRPEEAEELYLEALDVLPPGPTPLSMEVRNGLAFLLHDRGDYDGAEELYREVLELSTELRGEDHPTTLVYENNLAMLQKDRGELEEAAAMLAEVAAGYERNGLESASRARAGANRAEILLDLGRLDEAQEVALESLALYEAVLGEDSAEAGGLRRLLARIEDGGGR